MSLLIKALDNAEKNKKAEQSKHTTEEKSAAAPTLELEAIEPKATPAIVDTQHSEQPKIATSSYAANHLTLEEEAGLSLSLDPKYSKPKRGSDKSATKSTSSKPSTQATAGQSIETSHTKTPVLPPVFQDLAANNAAASQQKTAAKVFAANQAIQKNSSKTALFLLGVAGALIIWLGLQGYHYIQAMLAPQAVVVTPAPTSAVNTQEMAAVAAEAAQVEQGSTEAPPVSVSTDNETGQVKAEKPALNATTAVKETTTKPAKVEESQDVVVAVEPNLFSDAKPIKNKRSTKNNAVDTNPPDEDSSANNAPNSIKLVRKSSVNGVDPTLAAAYQAFVRGEDATAQQQYRQVLQRDVRNVDALLGMAAIAQRQGRDADAFGWYQKVLEIEPKNTIAQTAVIAQASSDSVASESRIKSLLAQQPEAANLHAALGNLYASQNQWPAAQEAYFNASRYSPNNADYAFNLAVSLEQLGKPNLALPQYQRALDLVNQSGAASPDKTQISARIRALQ